MFVLALLLSIGVFHILSGPPAWEPPDDAPKRPRVNTDDPFEKALVQDVWRTGRAHKAERTERGDIKITPLE